MITSSINHGKCTVYRMAQQSATSKPHHGQDEVGYEALACAIVKQAVEDYKTADDIINGRRKISTETYANRYTSIPEAVKAEVVRFFRGQWFGVLCDIPGERIIKHLEGKA